MPRLRRVDCAGPGLTRRRRGRGFEYLDRAGERIDDLEVLQRVKDLAIPPAWENVWICEHPNGHLQAVGTDDAGRKQYIYHPVWRQRRDQEKFDRMIYFAQALPKIRHHTNLHLDQKEMSRERVLACAVRLLDRGFFRIGGEGYAEENETFGLATMRKKHVRFEGRRVVFEYIAKSHKERLQSVVDPAVYEVVGALKKRRGGSDELLAYKAGGRWRDVKSADINIYLKEISGGDYTAKDFRTWHGTVMCAQALAVSKEALGSKTGRKRAVSRAIQEVAHYLGNTPAVCRASYVDPRVIDRYDSGVTIAPVLEHIAGEDYDEPEIQVVFEEAVLDLIEGNTKSPAVEKVPAAKLSA
ncbi:MAG TPA: DNA topoisomerase IB [Actinomycetota bacterium]|nr:DNA topoisomerase IB [Actinomycetota bacterium]